MQRGYGDINSQIARGVGADNPYNYLDTQKRAAETLLAEQRVMDYPEERNTLRALRSQQMQKGEFELDEAARQRDFAPIKTELEGLKYIREVAPMITWELYPESRAWLISRKGVRAEVMPDPQWFIDKAEAAGVEPAFIYDAWKKTSLQTVDQKLKEELQKERLESAERILNTKIEGVQKRQEMREQHNRELAAEREKGKEGRDLMSKQREARITVQSLFGMNEFNRVDEMTAEKAGAAMEEANRMLKDNPDLDAQTAAARAKRKIDRTYKTLDAIPRLQKGGFFSKGNAQEVSKSIRTALDDGIDTKAILSTLIEKGYSQEQGIEAIRNAAGIQ